MNLVEAAQSGNLEECKRLIENDINVHSDDSNRALWLAAGEGHLEVCKLLLEHGADVHANDDLTLRWAARFSHLGVCKLLLEHGADLKVLFTKDGEPKKIVYEFTIGEQIETAKKEWEIQKVMDS